MQGQSHGKKCQHSLALTLTKRKEGTTVSEQILPNT